LTSAPTTDQIEQNTSREAIVFHVCGKSSREKEEEEEEEEEESLSRFLSVTSGIKTAHRLTNRNADRSNVRAELKK
jgi:hypothetical protein